jgi:hypothetical protein
VLASESSVKGCVYRNVVPYWLELSDPYHVPNGVVRSTVTSVVFRLFPVAGVKWKCACVISRVDDSPRMATVIEVPLRVSVAELITGGEAGTVTATGTRVAGVMFAPPEVSTIVIVMVPAVDPDEKAIAGIAAVLFAGI